MTLREAQLVLLAAWDDGSLCYEVATESRGKAINAAFATLRAALAETIREDREQARREAFREAAAIIQKYADAIPITGDVVKEEFEALAADFDRLGAPEEENK